MQRLVNGLKLQYLQEIDKESKECVPHRTWYNAEWPGHDMGPARTT